MNTPEQVIRYQFYLKSKYQHGSQLWGNITCYTTLTNCDFGLRCLTWQNICDGKRFPSLVFDSNIILIGKQQCMDGIDEDHCEELEYNECEENQYRCEDGSCIPEQFWLDGQYDCSDQTDEQILADSNSGYTGIFCPLTSSQFDCDEATTDFEMFACGDGQAVYDTLIERRSCYNYRDSMYFCEFKLNQDLPFLWTLENGHCIKQGQVEKNLIDMDESEKCIFYLKCRLTGGTITGCGSIISLFHSVCRDKTINYPPAPVIRPYVQTVYRLSEIGASTAPHYIFFNGSIRCIGYHGRSGSKDIRLAWTMFVGVYLFDVFFCNSAERTTMSNPQIDENCWNNTKQSFLCQKSHRCISKHRLRDARFDCPYGEDENPRQTCYMTKQHRLICSGESPSCLIAPRIGDDTVSCTAADDEYIAQLNWYPSEAGHQCKAPNSVQCNILKSYTQSPLSALLPNSSAILPFRHYCNNVWELPRGFDESLCKSWKCPRDQYQCFSGHCIPGGRLKNVFSSWNCPDASDSIDLFRIPQLSEHNIQVITNSTLQEIKSNINALNNEYYQAPSATCNIASEYQCLLVNVTDPLNFTINRPCINKTRVGDGVIDCYGGLDERNLLTCGNNAHRKRGFDFHCDDQECIPYHRHCEQRCSNKADSLLCDQLPALWNSRYPDTTRKRLCSVNLNGEEQKFLRDKQFYCDSQRPTGEYNICSLKGNVRKISVRASLSFKYELLNLLLLLFTRYRVKLYRL